MDHSTLYVELQDDLNCIVGPLFGFAEQQVRKNGAFLPFGGILLKNGEIELQAATSGQKIESGTEVLRILHDGLKASANEGDVDAVAVCEWVKITLENGKQTDAMKVLVEHKRGLTIAFYVPCHKGFMRGWQFEEMFVQPATPEVNAWRSGS
jgi:hypothetical protein